MPFIETYLPHKLQSVDINPLARSILKKQSRNLVLLKDLGSLQKELQVVILFLKNPSMTQYKQIPITKNQIPKNFIYSNQFAFYLFALNSHSQAETIAL